MGCYWERRMIRKPSDMEVETRPNLRGGPGEVTFHHLFKKDEFVSNVRLCSRLTLPPGAGIGMHTHDREDELFYVLSGSGLLDDGITQTRVKAGDALLTGNGGAHSIRNDGNENLELIAVITCC